MTVSAETVAPAAGRARGRVTALAQAPARRWRAAPWVERCAVTYCALYLLWFVAGGTTGRARTFVCDAAYLPLELTALVLALQAARRTKRKRDRQVWVLFALALVFHTWADGAWFWLEAVQQTAPFPSSADIGFFGFYPLVTLALAMVPVSAQSRRASLGNALDVLAMVGGAFMVIWYLVLGSALQDGIHSLVQALNVAYPLWDLLMILAGGRVLLRGTDPRWTLRARWMITGAASFVVADIGFGYAATQSGFTGGGWLDLPWMAALLCFLLASSSSRAGSRLPSDVPGKIAGRAHLLPVLAIVASYVVVAKVGLHLPLFPIGGVLLIDLVITMVVLGRQFVAVAEHRDLAAQYRQAAVSDPLTGLANRRYFLQQAQLGLSQYGAGRCVVVMIDVDHFKQVNDQQGHQAGDAALQAVASHLQASVRPQDLLARFGGDEFVALLTDVTAEHAVDVVTRITDVRHLAGAAGKLSLSVGWALHGDTLDELLAHADVALYAAKAAGRGRAVAAHQRPDEAAPDAVARHAVQHATAPHAVQQSLTPRGAAPDGPAGVPPRPSVQIPGARSDGSTRPDGTARTLRHAIEHDQLTLHYQPKITAADGSVHGVEALVRWVHPQHGLRYPDAFLPQVETLGLMPALTYRVLSMALDQLRAWEADGLPALSVAVNLSGSGLSDPDLATRVQEALVARGLAGSRLVVEVTEQRLVEDLAGTGEALGELRRHGVRVSLDNFGSGVSSLTCLRDLPIDELKLDGAFVLPVVDDARSAALVQGTIGFAHAVGLPTVAEGVEDLATAEQLTRFGCDVLQGYALARPMPPSQVVHWLHQRTVPA